MRDRTSAQCHPCKMQDTGEIYLCGRAENTKKGHLLWTSTLGTYLEIPEILAVVPLQPYNYPWLSLQSSMHSAWSPHLMCIITFHKWPQCLIQGDLSTGVPQADTRKDNPGTHKRNKMTWDE